MNRYVTVLMGPLLTIAYLPWRLHPLRPRSVVFISSGGGGRHEFSCNPKYVLLALSQADAELDLSWVVEDPALYPELVDRGVRVLRHGSPAAISDLLTARAVVSNGAYLMWFPFRRDQYVINTWHGGGAYKRLPGDRDSHSSPVLRRKLAHSSRVTSLFLSSCRLFTAEQIRGTFGFTGEVAEIGLPRNDLLLATDRSDLDGRTRAALGLPATARTVLVAPTLRSDEGLGQPLDEAGLVTALTKRFGGDWWVLYRPHKLSTPKDIAATGPRWLDLADYPDMQELLSLADALVTDYSSSIWDFSLTGKPCFLYLTDLAAARERPGFYLDPVQWGFPLANENATLWQKIEQWDADRYREVVRDHHRNLGSVETGRAADIVAELILARLNAE